MKSVFRIGLGLLFILISNDSYGGMNNEVLLVVHDREITTNEFLYYFQKEGQDLNERNLRDYLDSFIKFQLKLAQAREEGFQNGIAFRNELTDYRMLLAEPYLKHEENEGAIVERLMREWDFIENPGALKTFYDLADERVFKGNWNPPAGQSFNRALFFIDGKSVYQKDFLEYLSEQQASSAKLSVKEYILSKYLQFVSMRLLLYENYKLEAKYPEFRFQLQEYRDAMLLLAITKKMIWSKVESDQEGLDLFYKENKKNYERGKSKDEIYEVLAEDYQASLTRSWEDELAMTYEVQINEKVLASIK